MQDALLEFEAVSFDSDRVTILRGIDFAIHRGEKLRIVGGPLAGKSLVLNLACRLANPTAGMVRGLCCNQDNLPGVVLDCLSLDDEMTVRGNLKWFGGLFGLFGKQLNKRVEQVAEDLGIRDLLSVRASELGTLEARMADLGRALIHAPDLLLIDEPKISAERPGHAAVFDAFLASPAAQGIACLDLRRHVPADPGGCETLVLHDGRLVHPHHITPTAAPEQDRAAFETAFARFTRTGSAAPPDLPVI